MAETTRLIFERLLKRYPQSYELHQVGLLHCHAVTTAHWPIHATMTVAGPEGTLHFMDEDRYGENTVRHMLPKLMPDIVFGFNDPQHLLHLGTDARERRHRLVLYFNIDGFPIPRAYYDNLLKADRLVVSSEFGKRAFVRSCPMCDPGRVEVMYSPADSSRFGPVSEAEKKQLRRELLPEWMPRDAFILGWVGVNQWRKQVWVLYQVIHLLRTGRYLICSNCQRIGLVGCQCCLGVPMSGAPRSSKQSEEDTCAYCGSDKVASAEAIDDIFLWLHMPRNTQHCSWPVELLERLYDVRLGRDIYYTESCETERNWLRRTCPHCISCGMRCFISAEGRALGFHRGKRCPPDYRLFTAIIRRTRNSCGKPTRACRWAVCCSRKGGRAFVGAFQVSRKRWKPY